MTRANANRGKANAYWKGGALGASDRGQTFRGSRPIIRGRTRGSCSRRSASGFRRMNRWVRFERRRRCERWRRSSIDPFDSALMPASLSTPTPKVVADIANEGASNTASPTSAEWRRNRRVRPGRRLLEGSAGSFIRQPNLTMSRCQCLRYRCQCLRYIWAMAPLRYSRIRNGWENFRPGPGNSPNRRAS